jgi:hypothetical protein
MLSDEKVLSLTPAPPVSFHADRRRATLCVSLKADQVA